MRTAQMLATTTLVSALLAGGLTGCGQVLGIEDWTEGAGGQGGEGGEGSQQAVSAVAASSGAQASAASSSGAGTGTGGQGGQLNGCDGACTPVVPSGWLGPVAVYVGDKAAALPECGPEWSITKDWLTGTLTATPAICSPCSCSPPAGGSCALTQVSVGVYNNATCTPPATATTIITTPNTCTTLALGTLSGTDFYSQLAGQSLPGGSSCTPMGGGVTRPPAYFDKHARLCANPTSIGDCTNGDLCVPAPPLSFRPSLCIYKAVADGTDPPCPNGYTALPYFYTDIADTRDCTQCTCGLPYNQSCSLTATIHIGNTCTSSPDWTHLGANACSQGLSANGNGVHAKVTTGVPAGGSCVPSSPNPTGEANGKGATLVCCPP